MKKPKPVTVTVTNRPSKEQMIRFVVAILEASK
jgi:hypothetical protein